jgi:hypothetical protein
MNLKVLCWSTLSGDIFQYTLASHHVVVCWDDVINILVSVLDPFACNRQYNSSGSLLIQLHVFLCTDGLLFILHVKDFE